MNINVKSDFIQVLGDLLSSIGVLIAAIIICINTEIYDIAQVNDFLISNELDVLETSKM